MPEETEYSRYMQTTALLSLQRRVEDMLHRDELLFQTVHQTTELWLKHACFELEEVTTRIARGNVSKADGLVQRASLGLHLMTEQLEMFRHLAPRDFHIMRPALGEGSGLQSPGWRALRRVMSSLRRAFLCSVEERGTDLVRLYDTEQPREFLRLAEALIELDERIALWRTRHYKIATRIIGQGVIGTKGMPVDDLLQTIGLKFFPELWDARAQMTTFAGLQLASPKTRKSELMP